MPTRSDRSRAGAPQPVAFAVLKGHHGELLRVFDPALAEALGDGIRDRLERRWLGGPADG